MPPDVATRLPSAIGQTAGKFSKLGKLGRLSIFLKIFAWIRPVGWSVWLIIVTKAIVETLESMKESIATTENPFLQGYYVVKAVVLPIANKALASDNSIYVTANNIFTTDKMTVTQWGWAGFEIFGASIIFLYLVFDWKLPIVRTRISFPNIHRHFVGNTDNPSLSDQIVGLLGLYLVMDFVAHHYGGAAQNYYPFEGVYTLFYNIYQNPRTMFPMPDNIIFTTPQFFQDFLNWLWS